MKKAQLLLLFLSLSFFALAQEEKESAYVLGMHIHTGADVAVFGDLQNEQDTLYNDGHLTMIGDSLQNSAAFKGQGTLEMLGDIDQHITHKGILIVDSLQLNNLLDISFDNDIVINKHTAFINGILYDNYDASFDQDLLPSVTFNQGADYDTFLVRDESHIEGLVRKRGHTRFIFPIGDAYYYRPAVIDNIASDTTISAHYYYDWISYPEEKLESGVELFRDEYWYVSGASNSHNLTLTYGSETSGFDYDEEDLKVVSYDDRFDSSYRIIDVEPATVMSHSAYVVQANAMDSSYHWYGFAKVDDDIDPETGLYVPQILSPNGDGHNDKFEIIGLDKYPNNKLLIFNRYGNVLYEKEGYDNSWDGIANKAVVGGANRHMLPAGTYYVFIYDGDEVIYKDFVQLLRKD